MHHTASEAVFLESLSTQLSFDAAPLPSKRHVRSRFKPVNHSTRDSILTTTNPNTYNEAPHHKFAKVIQYFTKHPKQISQETVNNGATPGFSRRGHDGTDLLRRKKDVSHASVRDFWKTVDDDVPPIETGTDSRLNPSAASSIRLDIYDAFTSMQTFEKQSSNDRYSASFMDRDDAGYPQPSSFIGATSPAITRRLVQNDKLSHISPDPNTDIPITPRNSRRGAISRLFRRGNLLRRTEPFGSREIKYNSGSSHFGTDSFPTTEFIKVQERGSGRPDLLSFWCTSNEESMENEALNSDPKARGARVAYMTLAKLNYFDSSAPVSHIRHQRNSSTAGQQLLARRTLNRVRNGTLFCNKDTTQSCEVKASPVVQLALRVKVNPQWEAEHAEIERIRMARVQGLEGNDYGEQRFGTRCDHIDWYRDSQVANYYESNRI